MTLKNATPAQAEPEVADDATAVSQDSRPGRRAARRLLNALGVTLMTGLAAAAVAGGVTVLHSRADSTTAPAPHPLVTVATEAVRWSEHYTVSRGYAGRLEAARQTAVAFERSGLVIEVKFEEGDSVAQGAIVARLDTDKLLANRRQLEAQRRELEAQRDLAELTRSRQNKLQARGWSPEQRYDEARFTVRRLEAAIARIDASVAALDIDIRKSELRAPFDGRVAERHVDEGAVVTPGTRVVTILEAASQRARIGLAPEAATTLRIGEAYQLTANGRDINARLLALRADLESGSRTVTAILDITSSNTIPLGEIAILKLHRTVKARGIWLPLSALVEGRKGLWTVLRADRSSGQPTIRREAVEVLHVTDTRAYVRGALKDGEHVVISGTNRITPGQRVALAHLN
jgi:RND family efflux transporter MFP subunit